jgi:phage terminase large subunit-like protein
MVGGRGIGKTLGGATWVNDLALSQPGSRIGIIAPTRPDASYTCVEGETGLLSVNPSLRFNRSKLEVVWPNGSRARLFGAYTPEDRERLRGPQFHAVWLEEFAAWRQLDEIPREDSPDAWQHVTMGLRLGSRPRFFMSSTPKRRRRFREILDRPDVVVTRASTYDASGLPQIVRDRLIEMYEGTRLGQQELLGEILEDVEGALWSEANLEQYRVESPPPLEHVMVGVDPAGSSSSGTVGIVAVGVSKERWPHPRTGRMIRHMYVLEDASISGPPEIWASAAIDLYHRSGADRIIAEPNYGGEMVRSVLRQIDISVPLKMVNSSKGKRVRAEPIAALSAQGLLHMIGSHPKLEDQLTGWVEGRTPWSPDRLDAMVFAATELLDHVRGRGGVHSPSGLVSDGPARITPQSRAKISR